MAERPFVHFYLDPKGIVLKVIQDSPEGEISLEGKISLRLDWNFGTQPSLVCWAKEEVPLSPDVFAKIEDDLRAMAGSFFFAFLRKEADIIAFLQKEEKEKEVVCNRFCAWDNNHPEVVKWGLRTGEKMWLSLPPGDREANLRLAGRLAKTLLAIARQAKDYDPLTSPEVIW